MPHPFKPYELEVLKRLLADEFTQDAFMHILEDASAPQVEYTNYGFYVSVQHPALGKARRVRSSMLAGRCGGSIAGFAVFIQDNTLTLDIFPWDGEALPPTFRDCAIELRQD